MSDHLWTQENLDAYLADGLTLAERATIERHLADCPACSQSLAQARKMENVMKKLFLDARPDANLESRAIRRLRKAPAAYPQWVRYAMAAAAMLVLGLLGAIAQAVATDGVRSPFALRNAKFTSVGMAINADSAVRKEATFSIVDGDPALAEFDTDINYMAERVDNGSVPGASNPNRPVGNQDDDKKAAPVELLLPDGIRLQLQDRALSVGGSDGTNAVGESGGFLYRPESLYRRSGETREGAKQDEGRDKGKRLKLKFDPDSNEETDRLPDGVRKPASSDYFKKPTETAKSNEAGTLSVFGRRHADEAEKKLGDVDKDTTKLAKGALKEKAEPANLTGQKQPEPPPVETGRKIIRTGDMDFETESFDAAVANITQLIGSVKGGFIATVNSDKLPNGKMRGSVVVRMPPFYLDKFIADLRLALGKTGELKSQRIGSQDVTKQYTDVESELRAARAVEERFLNIIKTGKGEIKDLVAAERELGIWRTKIEKMEGEIRYYNNLVSLSTLTINLTEKEITTPSSLVRNEKVQMRVEVDDVKKALENAVRGVETLKGRILKSESKQHKAGQFEAILHAEIPHGQKDAFRADLAKLGIVSEDEATQKTLAEGGAGKPREIKTRINDVLFEVTLNNIINIQPRHSVTIDIASSDVPAGFTKLQGAILREAKGQVRVANLNEPDKQRVTAQLEFNVPKEQKGAIDNLLAGLGPVLKKTNVQAPVTDIATDQKFGFVVNLFSVATIAAREKIVLKILVENVKAKAQEIEGLAKLSKGQANRGKITTTPQGEMSGVVVLHVPLSVSDALVKQLKTMGEKIIEEDETPNPNAPDNELATSLVIVHLVGGRPIVPSDQGLWGEVQRGLSLAFWLLSKGVLFIIIGLCGVVPWVLVIWGGTKAVMWMWGKNQPVEVTVAPTAEKPAPTSGEQPPA